MIRLYTTHIDVRVETYIRGDAQLKCVGYVVVIRDVSFTAYLLHDFSFALGKFLVIS